MEMNDKEMEMVAGGKVVETKEGKFVLLPPNAPEFDTREAAEEKEKKCKEHLCNHPHHRPHGHHFGMPGHKCKDKNCDK